MPTDTTTHVIRRATVDDAPALAAFARRAFRDAFAADNTPDDMAAYLDASFSPEIQRAQLAQPALTCLLVEIDGTLVGYAMVEANGTCAYVDDTNLAEIKRVYVDQSAHGTGVAGRLMDAALATAKAGGATCVFLGVFERNTRAIRFYEKHGFAIVGRQLFTLGTDVQNDLVMARTVV